MAHFFQFATLSRLIGDPQKAGMEALKPVAEQFENAVVNLKRSVVKLERFDQLFGEFDGKSEKEVSLQKINQKLFVDEFFAEEPRGQIVPQ
jgi:hypothetical protein